MTGNTIITATAVLVDFFLLQDRYKNRLKEESIDKVEDTEKSEILLITLIQSDTLILHLMLRTVQYLIL